jgi:hypothetical protein
MGKILPKGSCPDLFSVSRSSEIRRPPDSNPSRTAVADGDLTTFDDDGHFTPSVRGFQHLPHTFGVVLDIDISNVAALFGVIRTGRLGVRSAGFSIDQDFFSHVVILPDHRSILETENAPSIHRLTAAQIVGLTGNA